MQVYLQHGVTAVGCNAIGRRSARELEEFLAEGTSLGAQFRGLPCALCPACAWLLEQWQKPVRMASPPRRAAQ